MPKVNLLGYSQPQMEELMVSLGQKPYKGNQIFAWLYHKRQFDFSLMTNLTKDVRDRLENTYTFQLLEPEHEATSVDDTVKFLFRLEDGHPIETVLIPEEKRRTVCISVQAGCALGCRFCATGTLSLLRNLSPGEIVGQLLYLRERFGKDAFTNVVMMGMGEPLNNFDNVIEAVRIIIDKVGLDVSPKKVTVSTSGIYPKIYELADLDLKVRLAVSLHAATQAKREKIMPVARRFRLDKLMDAIRYFITKTNNRVTFEYILFEAFNDSMEDVKALSKLLRGIQCKVNVLAYNPVPGLPFERPSSQKVDWFARQLNLWLPAVTVRQSRGTDIDAACGQLAARQIKERGSNV